MPVQSWGRAYIVSGGGLLLDTLSATAIAAFSTRKLRSAYGGNALLAVTSHAGNATQNIGFVGNDLDTASLETFIGVGNDGGISTFYDQSTTGSNATIALAGVPVSQAPLICSNGVTVKQNSHGVPTYGRAAFGSQSFFNFTGLGFTAGSPIAQPITIAFCLQQTTITVSIPFFDSVTGAARITVGNSGTTLYNLFAGSTPQTGGTLDNSLHTIFAIFNTPNSSLIVDGSTIIGPIDVGSNQLYASAGVELISNGGIIGIVPEILVFNSALSAPDQSLISASWRSYWGTP